MRMLQKIGELCRVAKTPTEIKQLKLLLGHGVEGGRSITYESCKDQMTKEHRGAFDQRSR